MGYTCAACGKYERNNDGPCHHCGVEKQAQATSKPEVVNASKRTQSPPKATPSAPADPNAPHCRACSKHITNEAYVFVDNAIYHRGCYLRDIPCCYCDGPILANQQMRRVLDRNYHAKCFICTGCSKKLENEFTEVNGWPWCKDCMSSMEWQKRMREGGVDEKARQERLEQMRKIEEALRNHPGWEITFGAGGGFVVDPKTGEKRFTAHQPKIHAQQRESTH